MSGIRSSYTDGTNFFAGNDPLALVREYGSPLYVYNEDILRRNCRDMRKLIDLPQARVCYSAKANANPHLLRIIRSEGLQVDSMSPGELALTQLAGFTKDEIFYVCNNVSGDEFALAASQARVVSVDSIAQLEEFGRNVPGGEVMARLNPGIGAGHHKKVITAGKETKFGISEEDIPQMREVCARYNLRLAGLNQHVGSLFMQADAFVQAMEWLLARAEEFEGLKYIDFGGGFGIPYHKYENEARLDIEDFSQKCTETLKQWVVKTGYNGLFIIEPGRYVPAESGLLLGSVTATKNNGPTRYVCTDIGFNILPRPMLYGAFHDVEIYRNEAGAKTEPEMPQTIVGNICESGDILHKDYVLPEMQQGDIVGFLDAGAYCFSMASTYNQRVRPAELLILSSCEIKLIRRREAIEDLLVAIPPLG